MNDGDGMVAFGVPLSAIVTVSERAFTKLSPIGVADTETALPSALGGGAVTVNVAIPDAFVETWFAESVAVEGDTLKASLCPGLGAPDAS
ncbi:MAG TPA: hypothetical protein VNI78_06930 [Vicinamibacterales bacterium]|nr:hypothetical protein [Vicinamibacterales bacterium]